MPPAKRIDSGYLRQRKAGPRNCDKIIEAPSGANRKTRFICANCFQAEHKFQGVPKELRFDYERLREGIFNRGDASWEYRDSAGLQEDELRAKFRREPDLRREAMKAVVDNAPRSPLGYAIGHNHIKVYRLKFAGHTYRDIEQRTRIPRSTAQRLVEEVGAIQETLQQKGWMYSNAFEEWKWRWFGDLSISNNTEPENDDGVWVPAPQSRNAASCKFQRLPLAAFVGHKDILRAVVGCACEKDRCNGHCCDQERARDRIERIGTQIEEEFLARITRWNGAEFLKPNRPIIVSIPRCTHSVYNPHHDGQSCSICNYWSLVSLDWMPDAVLGDKIPPPQAERIAMLRGRIEKLRAKYAGMSRRPFKPSGRADFIALSPGEAWKLMGKHESSRDFEQMQKLFRLQGYNVNWIAARKHFGLGLRPRGGYAFRDKLMRVCGDVEGFMENFRRDQTPNYFTTVGQDKAQLFPLPEEEAETKPVKEFDENEGDFPLSYG